MSNASTIRPGLLVSLKSTVVGGVSYERVDLGRATEADSETSEWKTRRVIEDKVEHERAVKCRSSALAMIRRVCSTTSFGLLCPTDQEGALDAAITAARALADEHNAASKHTRVGIYALKGRVASDDAEAARAITQEISTLVQQMDAGIKAFDPTVIRDAATRARALGNMLSDDKQGKLDAAIDQARKAARTIVRRIEVEGEDRAVVLMDIARGQIESARIAFLDLGLDDADDTREATLTPSADPERFASLDVEVES